MGYGIIMNTLDVETTAVPDMLWTEVLAVMLSPSMSTPEGERPEVDFEGKACLACLACGAGRARSCLKRDT